MNKISSGDKRAIFFLVLVLTATGTYFGVPYVISYEKEKAVERLPVNQFSKAMAHAIFGIESPEFRVRELVKALEIKGRGNWSEAYARIRLADSYLDLGDTENAIRQLELCKVILAQPVTTGNKEYDETMNSIFKKFKRKMSHSDKESDQTWIYKVEKRLGRHPTVDKNPSDIAGSLLNRATEIKSPEIRKRELLLVLTIEHVPEYSQSWTRIRLADTYFDLGDTENAIRQLEQCKSTLAKPGVVDYGFYDEYEKVENRLNARSMKENASHGQTNTDDDTPTQLGKGIGTHMANAGGEFNCEGMCRERFHGDGVYTQLKCEHACRARFRSLRGLNPE